MGVSSSAQSLDIDRGFVEYTPPQRKELPKGVAPRHIEHTFANMKLGFAPLCTDIAGAPPRSSARYVLLLRARRLLLEMEGVQEFLMSPSYERFARQPKGTGAELHEQHRVVRPDMFGGNTWAFGTGTYGAKFGHRSVAWVVRNKEPPKEGRTSTPFCVIGVLSDFFNGWHTGGEKCVERGYTHEHNCEGERRADKDMLPSGADSAGMRIKVDCVTGQVTCTRLTDNHTHTLTHTVANSLDKVHRLKVDEMGGRVAVEIVSCVAQFL